MKDQLFMLRPGFHADGRGPLYCGDSASVKGFLAWFPQLHGLIDVIEIDAARPRQPIVALLGADCQSAPVLILDDASDGSRHGSRTAQGRRFIDDPAAIRAYLSDCHGLPEAA